GRPYRAGMRRIIVVTALVCACAKGTSSSGGAVDSDADAGSVAPDAGGGVPSGGDAGTDGGTTAAAPIPGAELIDPNGQYVHAISPDNTRVLLSHHLIAWTYTAGGFVPGTGDLVVATRGGAIKQLAAEGVWYGAFTNDGSAVVYRTQPHGVTLVHTDGSNPRQLTTQDEFTLAGRWLYYTDARNGQLALFRLAPPDGDPELVAGVPDPSTGPLTSGISYWTSPDGDLVVFCHGTPWTCSLVPAASKSPIEFAGSGASWQFSPDSNWVLNGCDLYDRNGAVRRVCDVIGWLAATFSPDGKLAIFDARATRVITLASMAETQLPPFSEALFYPWGFTPDGSRLIASASDSTGRPAKFFVANAAGGQWIELSNDAYSQKGASDFPVGLAISPDSRIVATSSRSQGVVESIAGGPAQVVTHSGDPLFFATPVFEPAGGHGKAIFYERGYPDYRLALGNADGSGGWIELGTANFYPRWFGHSFLSFLAGAHDSSTRSTAYDILVTTDDGALTNAPFLSNVSPVFFDQSVDHAALYFTPPSGGLYRGAVPQPAP
ncbi:MAG: hypothetical protein ACJ79H_17710, partial [Myxococcales bacterium]